MRRGDSTTAVEPYFLRPFRPDDLAAIVALWNRCLTKDPISEDRFWHHIVLDANFDPEGALVAEADGEIAGFLQAIVRRVPMPGVGTEPETGFITVFFVAPHLRRQGLGTALLKKGLDYLRQQGRSTVSCNGYSPIYFFPGVDEDYTAAQAFLRAGGFAAHPGAVAMGMRLEGVRMPEAVRARAEELRAKGYEVRMFERADTLPLIAFSLEHFPEYGDTIRDGLQRGDEEIVVATKDGEIVGYTQWENTYTDPPSGAEGRFGPFGVRADLRSKGIGSVIFYTLIERVVSRGSRYLWFGWAGGRNLSFYERASCRVTRRFTLYTRSLEG
ncbi:MAG TPA: GNAT family N-acetyltransferase [Chloroflexota bacterium]|nr:GNAT family N-acetyltransferase [Chloroflexota bacterium]